MWELLFLSLLPVAVAVFALRIWRDFAQPYLRLRAWQDAAGACGLQVVGPPGWKQLPPEKLSARAGPVTVTIQTCGNKGRYTQIFIWLPGPPDFQQVRIQPLVRRAREIEVGDPAFDSTFLIEGPTRLVLALLDAKTRRLLIWVNAVSRLTLSAGTLQAEDMSDKKVPYALPLLLDLGRQLTEPIDVLQRLTENAHCDPEPGVRLQNLLLLVRELPEDPRTLAALRGACSDPSPEIRLRAAQALGAEGRDLLLDLAEGLVDDAVSAEAVSILARELPFERTREILARALDGSRLQTARVCLEALSGSGDARAEPLLIDVLQRQEADLRVAAATALGRAGSAAAVLPLKEATERSWLDRELHRTTRQAIAEIQSRLPGASPGQLSVASSEAGQLSLAQAEAGQLSLAQAEIGQMSLAVEPHALPPEEPEQPAQRRREGPGVRPV